MRAIAIVGLIIAIGVLIPGARAVPPLRKAFPKITTEPANVDYKAKAAYWHARYVKAHRLAVYREKQRNAKARALRGIIAHPPYGTSPEEAALLCIHFNPRVGHGEGAWGAHTGNGYDGGLQMDRSFQRSYGRIFLKLYGPAYLWPVSVQLAVGIIAVKSGRGYYPWPNTGRSCGLIR